MEAVLAYVNYPYKMSFAAIKQYKDRTGRDLWNSLLSCMTAYSSTKGQSPHSQLKAITDEVGFLDASELLHALFKAENSCLSLNEIQDGMQMVGGRPCSDSNDKCEVWPLLLVVIGYEIDEYYQENLKDLIKKKADISDK